MGGRTDTADEFYTINAMQVLLICDTFRWLNIHDDAGERTMEIIAIGIYNNLIIYR